MAINKELDIRYINGKKYRFEPTTGELADLVRKPFVDLMSATLAGLPDEVVAKAVTFSKAQHEAEEDKRIALVQEHHARIRKDGVEVGKAYGSRWYTTHRG